MRNKIGGNSFSWIWIAAAPLLAVALYGWATKPFLDAPDLEIVSDNPRAAETLPGNQIWLAPIPAERPDLGIYRPIHGLLLKLEYQLWPGNVLAWRRVSVALWALICLVEALWVCRLFSDWLGRLAAVGIFVAHPLATESVNWLGAQNVLVAMLGWILALWIYQLAKEQKLRGAIASPVIAFCFFVALGAFEPAILLPVSLLVLGKNKLDTDKKKNSAKEKRASGVTSLFIYGIPLTFVAFVLIGLRWIALDGVFGPKEDLWILGKANAVQRILTAPSVIMAGLLHLILPLRPTFFFPARYELHLIWPIWIGAPLLAIFSGALVWCFRKWRSVALAAVLTVLPLLSVVQIVPLTNVISERILLLCLPGLALLTGEIVSAFAAQRENAKKNNENRKIVVGIVGAVILIFSAATLIRNGQWKNPEKLWASEVRRHPATPDPVVYQLLDLISSPQSEFALATIGQKAEGAIKLAKPPDADPIYQYLALLHASRNAASDLQRVVQDGINAPGPHVAGFYSSLGISAMKLNLFDLAESAFRRELNRDPKDFNSLYPLSELEMRRERWQEAMGDAQSAESHAPAHRIVAANLRLGVICARINSLHLKGALAMSKTDVAAATETGMKALTKAVNSDPTLAEPYLVLARMLSENGDYARAEQILTAARQRAKMESLAELCRIQVESLERQKAQARVFDFLNEMASLYKWDMPLQFYAARYFLDHRQYPQARQIYFSLMSAMPDHPDALYGMARIAFEADGDARQAAQFLRSALAADPRHAESRELLRKVGEKLGVAPLPSAK